MAFWRVFGGRMVAGVGERDPAERHGTHAPAGLQWAFLYPTFGSGESIFEFGARLAGQVQRVVR